MIYLTLTFALIFSSLTACQLPLPRKNGDRPLKILYPVAEAPRNIQKASESIFFMVIPGAPKTLDISTEKKVEAYELNQKTPLSKFEKQFVNSQIEVCRIQKKLAACPVSREFETTTAFVMKDKRHLYTIYDPLFQFVDGGLKLNVDREPLDETQTKLKSLKLPIFLFNNAGETVLSPATHLVVISNVSLLNLAAKEAPGIMSDFNFVELEMSSEIKGAEPLGFTEIADQSQAFLVGYPAQDPAADGERSTLRFSKGNYLAYDRAAKRMRMKTIEELSSELAELARKATFFFEGEALPGMSGAPYLNSSGKVVGMHRTVRKSIENLELATGVRSGFLLDFPYPLH